MLLCITNSMGGRGCLIRGHHLSTCPGEDHCSGCLPRPAETGILCRSCWEKFEAALAVAVELVTHLRSIQKGPLSVVPTHSAPGSRVILPGSWMQADQLWVALAQVAIVHAADTRSEEPVWRPFTSIWAGFSHTATLADVALAVRELVAWLSVSPANVVARTGGAEEAVKFYRDVQRSLAMFPLEEKPSRIRYLRCRTCGQFTMLDRPPLEFLEARVMQCADVSCGALYDPQLREFDLRLFRLELEAEMAARAAGEEAA